MVCTVDRIAALKILLHSAKYPSSSVNGVLLGPSPAEASSQGSAPNTHDEGPSSVHVTDAIPLFHSFLTLAPSLETALFQVILLCMRPAAGLPATFAAMIWFILLQPTCLLCCIRSLLLCR